MANVLVAIRDYKQCPEKYQISSKDNITILLENCDLVKSEGECWSRFQKELMFGTIVEVHKKTNHKISVGVYRKNYGVNFITVDKAIFDEEALSFNEKVVSQYEIFWSAGVEMDPNRLKPYINEEGETSLPGIFYYELERRNV